MKLNNRGEAVTLTLVAVAGIALLIGTIAPQINPFNAIFGQKPVQQEESTWTRRDEIHTPMLLESKSGEHGAVVLKSEYHYDKGTEKRPVKPTLGERIGGFFAKLSTGAIIFVVVSLVFFGGAPLIWVWRKYATMKASFKTVVAGIREIEDEDAYKKITKSIGVQQKATGKPEKHRKVIDKIKTEIPS